MSTITRPLLVQFGAGNIGRSLVGQLFSTAGWRVVFVDVAASVIDALNTHGRYDVVIQDDPPGSIPVDSVSGIHMDDSAAVKAAVVQADLVGTSVGAGNLEAACASIASALPARTQPLSVMLCENLHGAAPAARRYFRRALGDAYGRCPAVGFVEAAISKMVPPTPPEIRAADPLIVFAEAYNTLYLDADAFVGDFPQVNGVAWRRPFAPYVDRKLFLHNFPHAAAAYHGALRGLEFIWQCMEDEDVFREVQGCMREVGAALAVRHQETFTYDENRAWSDDLLRRFRNRSLADPVYRVGRDLSRKLAPDDRCIGALRLIADSGLTYEYTARAIAAGLHFDAAAIDPKPLAGDIDIQRLAATRGPETVMTSVSALDPVRDADAITRITEAYSHFDNGNTHD